MVETTAPDHAAIATAPSWLDRFRLQEPYYDVWRWHTLHQDLPDRVNVPRTDVAGLLQQWSDQEAAAERQADLQRQVDELKGKTSDKDKPAKVDTKP